MRKEFLKKALSVFFAVIMLISLIPMNVFAAEGSTESVNIEIIEEGITITQLGASAYKVEGLPEEEGYSWYYQPEKLSAGQSISEGIQRVIDDYTEAPNDRINELVSALNSANVFKVSIPTFNFGRRSVVMHNLNLCDGGLCCCALIPSIIRQKCGNTNRNSFVNCLCHNLCNFLGRKIVLALHGITSQVSTVIN
jgi:hypothetical protein